MARLKSGSHKFASKYGEELCKFLGEAQAKYASGEVPFTTMNDGRHLLEYARDDWSYSDLWYGGEPFGGMTTISKDGEVCFTMVYFGKIMPYADKDAVMQALMEALQHYNPACPWRGPREYTTEKDRMHYSNQQSGGVRRFSGTERIVSEDGKETLYEASYLGGIVDKD